MTLNMIRAVQLTLHAAAPRVTLVEVAISGANSGE